MWYWVGFPYNCYDNLVGKIKTIKVRVKGATEKYNMGIENIYSVVLRKSHWGLHNRHKD